MKRYYKAAGAVRGACSHRHRSMRTAYKCAIKDGVGLTGGLYADRSARAFEEGVQVDLTPEELADLDELRYGE